MDKAIFNKFEIFRHMHSARDRGYHFNKRGESVMSRGKLIIAGLIVIFIILVGYPAITNRMFILWPNTVLWICVALVGSTIGFIIYGIFKGFENTFPND